MAKPKNWARVGKTWYDIASLTPDIGPVVMADETQTVTWYLDKSSDDPIDHEGEQLHPKFWSPAIEVD